MIRGDREFMVDRGGKEWGRWSFGGGFERGLGREVEESLGEGKLLGNSGLHMSWLVGGILGSSTRKYDFLELGRQRGSVPSWLGGNNFRQF
jgi:hypothetical protein